MQMKKKIFKKIVISFALLLTCVLGLFSGFGITNIALAESDTSSYTNVLDDLKKDENFNVESYPKDTSDLSLKVIQIAETTGKELLIYVYQPCVDKQYMAKSINISIANSLKFKNYKLVYLNNEEALYKFKVDGLKVSDNIGRHYEISSILRSFIKGVDKEPGNDNTVSEKAYNVGQKWQAVTVDNNVFYHFVDVETVEITDKFVGFIRYENLNNVVLPFVPPFSVNFDSHFVAFSTDHDIDRLISADISYKYQHAKYYLPEGMGFKNTFGKETENEITVTSEKRDVTLPTGLFTKATYQMDRISSIEDFTKSVDFKKVYSQGLVNQTVMSNLTESGVNALKGKQWVFRFHESVFSETARILHNGLASVPVVIHDREVISDVTILRLEFETDGVVYNLGVVDNKQTGGDNPVNEFEIFTDGTKLKKLITIIFIVIAVLVGLVLLSIFSPVFKAIFVVIGKGIYYFFKGLWWLISAPFSFFKDD